MVEEGLPEVDGRISASVGLTVTADPLGSAIGFGAAGAVVVAGDGGIETALPVAADRMLA